MAVNPGDDPDRSRDLTRLCELTDPHLPHPRAPIQQALPHMGSNDRAEVIVILSRFGGPGENAPA